MSSCASSGEGCGDEGDARGEGGGGRDNEPEHEAGDVNVLSYREWRVARTPAQPPWPVIHTVCYTQSLSLVTSDRSYILNCFMWLQIFLHKYLTKKQVKMTF